MKSDLWDNLKYNKGDMINETVEVTKPVYKAPNPAILQLQVLKAKPVDATYIEVREFRKYSKLDTTLFTFNKCFKPFAINKSTNTEVKGMNYGPDRSEKEFDRWLVFKLYIPIKDFNLLTIKNAYSDTKGRQVERLGVFTPQNVLFTIDTPKLEGDQSLQLKNYVKTNIFSLYFRPMHDLHSSFNLTTNVVVPRTKKNDPYTSTYIPFAISEPASTYPMYTGISRKNWSFITGEPKKEHGIIVNPYKHPPTTEDFK